MIRKMQQKFVFVVMISFAIVTIIVAGGINIVSYSQMIIHYDEIIDVITENDGEIPDYETKTYSVDFGYGYRITEETKFETRYFTVNLDKDGSSTTMDISHVAAVTDEDAAKYGERIYKLSKGMDAEGTYMNYRYRLTDIGDESMVIFVDMSQQLQNIRNIKYISMTIAISIMMLLFVITNMVSKRVLYPLIENIEKQKQFITDAGHELKTPLAVISANADVLELTTGKSEWIDSIRNQTMQMNELVKRLLFLSKMEEGQQNVMADFDMSEVVNTQIKQLSTIATSTGKTFTSEIQENIHYKGDVNAITHLASVLIENAVKYSLDNGNIDVKLYKTGRTIHFEVRNSGEHIDNEYKDRLFERFYRPDSSRNKQTGGHGIGLSIAKAVVTSHKGKISVENEANNIVAFLVEL